VLQVAALLLELMASHSVVSLVEALGLSHPTACCSLTAVV
jgi:hypothetical protein